MCSDITDGTNPRCFLPIVSTRHIPIYATPLAKQCAEFHQQRSGLEETTFVTPDDFF
jgi:hypothetical protein